MLWLSRKDIEHISRRLLRDYLKKVPQKVDHIDPADFAEKMCGLQSAAHGCGLKMLTANGIYAVQAMTQRVIA